MCNGSERRLLGRLLEPATMNSLEVVDDGLAVLVERVAVAIVEEAISDAKRIDEIGFW